MEIIIHGKPHAGSSKATSDIDGLARNIVENFFNSRDEFDDEQSLIVDARYWKNNWYSVYTYRRSNLKEFSSGVGRTTYFAISLVIPGGYCRRVSAVYELLKNVCNDAVIGTYISGNGKYMVQNLYDNGSFVSIAEKVRKNYISTEVAFDSEFVPLVNFGNDKKSNVLWCDSEEFIRCLKTSGRIIVTEGESVKDPLLEETVHNSLQYDDVTAEKRRPEELKDNSKELLIGTNRFQSRKSSEEEPESKTCNPLYGHRGDMRQSSSEKKSGIKWIRVLPLVNTVLIVLTWIFIAVIYDNERGWHRYACDISNDINSLKERLDVLEKGYSMVVQRLSSLENNKFESRGTTEQPPSDMDEDCDFCIYQNLTPIKVGDVLYINSNVAICFTSREGYKIHTAGLSNKLNEFYNSACVKLNPKETTITKITINYRSGGPNDLSKLNKKNKVVFEKTQNEWIRTE